MQIASIHNLAFYLRLVTDARTHIEQGDFVQWKASVIEQLGRRIKKNQMSKVKEIVDKVKKLINHFGQRVFARFPVLKKVGHLLSDALPFPLYRYSGLVYH